jgi:hypothetical protein
MRRIFPLVFLSGVLGLSALHCRHEAESAPTRTVASGPKDAGMDAAPHVPEASVVTIESLGQMPTKEQICARAVTVVEPRPGTKPFERPEGLCKNEKGKAGECTWGERYDFPPTANDRCFVAQSNIDDASRKVRATPRPLPMQVGTSGTSSMPPEPMPAPARAHPWDGKAPLQYAPKVEAHLAMTESEKAMLGKNGFAVLARKPVHSYVAAYHDIFQEQLPLYVTTDSILHAIFRSEDALLEGIERIELHRSIATLVSRLRDALSRSPRDQAAEDVDLYLTVAAKLADTANPKVKVSTFGSVDRAADVLVRKIDAGDGSIETVEMYGRPRAIDFSKYVPVGHYAGFRPDELAQMDKPNAPLTQSQYFQVMTWLSRHEWNLVSRGCQSSTPVDDKCSSAPTPREVAAALRLAELVDRAGVRPILDRIESVYRTFGGVRDDVPITALRGLVPQTTSADPKAAETLATAIGDRFPRFAVTHPMPVFPGDHEGKLPAIATLIGARVAPDLDPVGQVMRAVYPQKLDANVFGTLLGHDPAARNAASSTGMQTALTLAPTLRGASAKGTSLYDTWMSAILALGTPPEGTLPGFFRTAAHANLRMNSALVGYGQIRHNFVLMSGSSYDSYGCEIPDAYVEPQLASYEALLAYAERGRALGASDRATREYFGNTANVLRALIAIVKHELEGRRLTAEEVRYLGMITEYTPDGGYGGDSHGPPKRTGWYYDLFTDRAKLAEMGSDFVGEVATNAHSNDVFMVGAEPARLGVFAVDTGGLPRLMVGPVATGYEAHETLGKPRWTDELAAEKTHTAEWAKSYTAPAPPEPSVEGSVHRCEDGTLRVFVRSTQSIEGSDVTLTDHHGDAVTARIPLTIGPDGAVIAVREGAPLPKAPSEPGPGLNPEMFGSELDRRPSPFAGAFVHVGAHREGTREVPAYGFTLGPSVYHASTGIDFSTADDKRLPERSRYRKLEDFRLGAFADRPREEPSRGKGVPSPAQRGF